LKHALAQQCHKVSLHTILIGVMGTIYKCHTESPLSKLGLDRCRVRKLTLDFNTHSIQHATTHKYKYEAEKHQGKNIWLFSKPSRSPLMTFSLV